MKSKPDNQHFSDFERINREKLFHDDQAANRVHAFSSSTNFIFTNEQYLGHEPWVRPAILKLGKLQDKRILDLGCGHGMAAVLFARSGATVVAIDVSQGYLQEAKNRAISNGVSLNVLAACAEMLPFKDDSFDLIWGNAILHHLDLQFAAKEILRVLAPGGKAVFCEPVSLSPLSRWIRKLASANEYQKHTQDEDPLNWLALMQLKQLLPNLSWQGSQFLGLIPRFLKTNWLCGPFDLLDRFFCWISLFYNRLCRYAILEVKKPG